MQPGQGLALYPAQASVAWWNSAGTTWAYERRARQGKGRRDRADSKERPASRVTPDVMILPTCVTPGLRRKHESAADLEGRQAG